MKLNFYKTLQNQLLKTTFCGLLLGTSFAAQAQGMIINEVSNGESGSREYVELLVVGSNANKTGNVNLTGWVIDDNNGSFSGTSASGLATGHIRIKSTCTTFQSVPVGSLIVIYNAADKCAAMPADDPTDSNGDKVYIMPHTNACLEACSTLPISTNTAYTGSTYAATTLSTPANTSWGIISLANAGDAFQVRKPDYTFYHGFCYGLGSPFPNFPTEFGGGASFNFTTSSTGSTFKLLCGNWTNSANYSAVAATVLTNFSPGIINSVANGNMIERIKLGQFNYADLNDGANCLTPLPLDLIQFSGSNKNTSAELYWQTASEINVKGFSVEKSNDGISFRALEENILAKGASFNTYMYVDAHLETKSYYRLLMKDNDGSSRYSKVIFVDNKNKATKLMIYPNPSFEQDNMNVRIDGAQETNNNLKVVISTQLGATLFELEGDKTYLEENLQTRLANLPRGMYILNLQDNDQVFATKYMKQ